MLDGILDVGDYHIRGVRSFSAASTYCVLEALAQLGAYLVRHLTGFSRHVFLIKIARCTLPAVESIEGEYLISGELINRSDSSFCCLLETRNKGDIVMTGEFLFAAVPYDENFKEARLRTHYQKVFQCLLNDTRTA